MTELEKLELARTYIAKLAIGVNPLNNAPVSETDIVNNVRISRCLFYVSEILRQAVENGGAVGGRNRKREKKEPFNLPFEKRNGFEYSDIPISISEIVRRINALLEDENMQKLRYSDITAWLIDIGMLYIADLENGEKRPTDNGMRLGISVEERIGANGEYHVVVYSVAAQQFILDNLDAVIFSIRENTEMQGKPWSKEADELLTSLYRSGAGLHDMALRLRRRDSSVRARLKRLGLVAGKEQPDTQQI